MKAHAFCTQFRGSHCGHTIEEMAKYVYKNITATLPGAEEYVLIAHSYGCIIAVEVIALFEANGQKVKAIFLDGSLDFVLQSFAGYTTDQNVDLFDSEIILSTIEQVMLENKPNEGLKVITKTHFVIISLMIDFVSE